MACTRLRKMSPELSAVSLAINTRLAKDPRLPDTGDLVAGRYRVRRPLGSGGMSAVFVAEDEQLGRKVALKVLYPDLRRSHDLTARFMNEACTLAQLSTRYVVAIYDSGFAACDGAVDLPFMALELVRGADLWTLVHDGGRLASPLAVRYMLDVCEGLAHAHARGIVHRDLKPENLFVALEADGSECVKVFDFGIAKAPGVKGRRDLTRHGESMGSPHYMSPEQLQAAREVDARSDVWAVGAVLYELLTGCVPFDGATPLEICSHILCRRPTPPAELSPELPLPLCAVVERCLMREREARFGDVAELYAALAPFGGSEGDPHAERAMRLQRLLSREQADPIPLRRRRSQSPPDARTASGPVFRVRRWLNTAVTALRR
ncbi:MAG TPA: serine/threonine-protein kinase [Polyangiaceae bacterium]|nr:serine/threonine-protein kinase [Polyangiaceae bacterium]